MAFANGKLGKLTFIFFPDSRFPALRRIPFVVQYNPSSLNVVHSLAYDKIELPLQGAAPKYLYNHPRSLTLDLLFDGTGASPSSLDSLGNVLASAGLPANSDINRVDVQVALFLKLAYKIDPELHQPKYMMMVWGTFIMTCRLTKASVNYTMFASDGTPLRARVSISVEEYIDSQLFAKENKLESPDLSKSVTVLEGDTLQGLCYKIYGDPSLYTQIAEVNKLNNYRKLVPGTELLFPPINASLA